MGFTHRAKSGLNASFKPPFSHLVRRDEYGRALKDAQGNLLPMVVDESKRPLFDGLADLLLSHVGFYNIELELAACGFLAPSGKHFALGFAYSFFYNPAIWGHSARWWNDHIRRGRKRGTWIYDETQPIPEGVLVFRNTHEPVYKGEQAERIKCELDMRHSKRGRSGQDTRHLFSGLLLCGKCGYTLGYQQNHTYLCFTRYIRAGRECSGKIIREADVQKTIEVLLEQIIEEESFVGIHSDTNEQEHYQRRHIEHLNQQHTKLSESIARLIRKQAELPDELADGYDAQITMLSQQRSTVANALKDAERELSNTKPTPMQLLTAAQLREMTLRQFWTLSDTEINHLLHQIFGKWRLVVTEGKITSIIKKT